MYAHVGWCRASDCSGAALSPPNSGDCRTAPTSQHSLEYVVCGRILGRRGEAPRPTFFSCRTCATERGCTRMSVGAEQATALAQPHLRRIQEIVGLHPHRNIPWSTWSVGESSAVEGRAPRPTFFSCQTCAIERECTRMSNVAVCREFV